MSMKSCRAQTGSLLKIEWTNRRLKTVRLRRSHEFSACHVKFDACQIVINKSSARGLILPRRITGFDGRPRICWRFSHDHYTCLHQHQITPSCIRLHRPADSRIPPSESTLIIPTTFPNQNISRPLKPIFKWPRLLQYFHLCRKPRAVLNVVYAHWLAVCLL